MIGRSLYVAKKANFKGDADFDSSRIHNPDPWTLQQGISGQFNQCCTAWPLSIDISGIGCVHGCMLSWTGISHVKDDCRSVGKTVP